METQHNAAFDTRKHDWHLHMLERVYDSDGVYVLS